MATKKKSDENDSSFACIISAHILNEMINEIADALTLIS